MATFFGRVIDLQKGESDQLTEAAADVFSSGHEGKKSSFNFATMLLSMQRYISNFLCLIGLFYR